METAGAKTTQDATADPLESLYGVVEAKIAAFDPAAADDEESEFTSTETVGLTQLVGRQANACDKLLAAGGAMSAFLFGVANPAMLLLFGEMVDSLGSMDSSEEEGMSSLKEMAFYQLYVGCGAMVMSAFQIALFSTFSERIAFKTRVQYF